MYCNQRTPSLEIKVRRIGSRWHARLYVDDLVYDEMACTDKRDIGHICRIMLRWLDKSGYGNQWTASARRRLNNDEIGFHGKIFYQPQLKRRRGK